MYTLLGGGVEWRAINFVCLDFLYYFFYCLLSFYHCLFGDIEVVSGVLNVRRMSINSCW